jgi:H+/gluconate symporter-like permease
MAILIGLIIGGIFCIIFVIVLISCYKIKKKSKKELFKYETRKK